MNEIIIKVPRKRKRIEIIRSKEELDNHLKLRKQKSAQQNNMEIEQVSTAKSARPQYS